jgi:hypothetical protein
MQTPASTEKRTGMRNQGRSNDGWHIEILQHMPFLKLSEENSMIGLRAMDKRKENGPHFLENRWIKMCGMSISIP